MQLYVIAPESLEELDKFQAADWLEAVQHVETSKEKYIAKGLTKVFIVNKKANLHCPWNITSESRPNLLKDKLPKLSNKKS